MTTSGCLRFVAAATALSVALGASATPVRAQGVTPSPAHSVRAAIGREAARLAEAGARRTTARPHLQPQAAQERRWVARHPALTGALIGAGVGATYGYVMCRGACEGQPGLYMTFLGGIGAGVGAGTGAIVGALRH